MLLFPELSAFFLLALGHSLHCHQGHCRVPGAEHTHYLTITSRYPDTLEKLTYAISGRLELLEPLQGAGNTLAGSSVGFWEEWRARPPSLCMICRPPAFTLGPRVWVLPQQALSLHAQTLNLPCSPYSLPVVMPPFLTQSHCAGGACGPSHIVYVEDTMPDPTSFNPAF